MKLFIDTASLADIEEALQGGFIRGITTNPSLFAKEPKGNYFEHIKKIIALARRYDPTESISVSVEVFSDDKGKMVEQARQFQKEFQYPNLAVKVHVSHKGTHYLDVIRQLSGEGIIVNATACMTPLQAMMTAAAGAKYVSLFYNRIRDGQSGEQFAPIREQYLKDKYIEHSDFDPNGVVSETRALISEHYPKAEIIVGSIRTPLDVKQAAVAGAHIVTASLKILKNAAMHYKTDEAVDGFFADFSAWTSS